MNHFKASIFLIFIAMIAWNTPQQLIIVNNSQIHQIPAQTCDDAKLDGLAYVEGNPPPPDAPNPLPFPDIPTVEAPESLPIIQKEDGSFVYPTNFMPEDLDFQAFEGNPKDIAKVGQAIRDADAGKGIRISVFGASHTSADFWTGHLRRVLQARYGDGGHGYIMPVSMFKDNRANDINICNHGEWVRDFVGRDNHEDDLFGLGLTASSSNPSDFAWIETTHSNPIGRSVSFFDILTLGQFGGGSLLAQVDMEHPLLISTQAESNQLQTTRIQVNEGSHRLTISPAGDGQVRIFGISMENDDNAAIVDSIGIRGREANTWLEWNNDIFQQSLHHLDPNIIVLAYGTNEANDTDYTMEAYQEDLRKVLDKMRRASPNTACILVGPSDRGSIKKNKTYVVWERTKMVAQVQREIAPEFNCVFWDWQQMSGGEGSMIAWLFTNPPLASTDLIHFSQYGYILSAENFIEALDNAALHFHHRSYQPFFRR